MSKQVWVRTEPLYTSGRMLRVRWSSCPVGILDGLVIDCDDVPGGTKAIPELRNTPANKQTLILAVVNGWTSAEEALDLGADFALSKPIQQTRLRRVLDIAIPKMEREHRRYFRYDVDLPVRFRNPLGQSFTTRMQNVSEGGLAIKLIDPLRIKRSEERRVGKEGKARMSP